MAIDYKSLPVYEQKQRILDCLEEHQVVIVESPTGSGKTTQIPVILYEAGYGTNGIIGVTQPRRIAALSVSEFISKQFNTPLPGLVGYKMRFEDQTNFDTRIKIMTDGILLQEVKQDPLLSKYSVLMIDEAHERSLNIDFVLGLVKRILKERTDFHVIVSSATMNTQIFSDYFDEAPIVSIDTITYPITTIYDPVTGGTTSMGPGSDALVHKIVTTVERVIDNDEDNGSILVFLTGEKIIKDCIAALTASPFGNQLYVLPLYGRLTKEEQERVFDPAPEGKRKIVVSTNIAETSVTISDVTTVIDSGLSKLNYYSPRTYTSSLIETPISKAASNQRKGRAGRTQPGTCYRLYTRKDFETRTEYTLEEIYRTDLSEVVLRMAELGITNFYDFDFISNPGREGINGAVETLNWLGALNEDNTLTEIGELMVRFPLEPRISRMIVHSMLYYPDVICKVIVAAAFLSCKSPYAFPQGEEMEARQAHHGFRDMQGDFVSYLKIYRQFEASTNKTEFCKRSYLDERKLYEIENVVTQLGEIVGELGFLLKEDFGNNEDYLTCICAGMAQFVCIRSSDGRTYNTTTADNIFINPGSSMFKMDPLYIVAGEIQRTGKTYALSVSPVTRKILSSLDVDILDSLTNKHNSKAKGRKKSSESSYENKRKKQESAKSEYNSTPTPFFQTKKISGKKTVIIPLNVLYDTIKRDKQRKFLRGLEQSKGVITLQDGGLLMKGEKVTYIADIAKNINLWPIRENSWDRHFNGDITNPEAKNILLSNITVVLRTAIAKQNSKSYGFITLMNNGSGCYWFKVYQNFSTALVETHSSLETLIDEDVEFTDLEKSHISKIFRMVNSLYED